MPVYRDKRLKKNPWYVKMKNKTYRGFATKAEAKRYETKLNLLAQDDERSMLLMNFSVLSERYLEYCEENLSYGSYQKFRNLVSSYILPNLPNKIVIDLSEADCLNFRSAVVALELSTDYKNGIIQLLKAIFKFAVKYYGLEKNPSEVIDKIKRSHKESIKRYEKQFDVWNYEEFGKFIDCVHNERYRLFFILLYFTGMRIGECLALTWREYEDKVVHVRSSLTRKTKQQYYEIKSPKTQSSIRDIALNNSVAALLDEFKEKEMKVPGFEESWFIFGRLSPLPQVSIDRVKDKTIQDSGVKRIRIHDFRHSHATNLINDGVNIVAVSKRLGHSDISMTLNTYTHLLQKSSDELVENLEKSSQILLKNECKQ